MSKEKWNRQILHKTLKMEKYSASDNTNNNDTISNTKTSQHFYPCGLINTQNLKNSVIMDSDLLNKTIQHNKDVLASTQQVSCFDPF